MKIHVAFELAGAGKGSADIIREVSNVLVKRVSSQTNAMFTTVEIMVTDDALIAEYFDRDHKLTTHVFPVTLLIDCKPRETDNHITMVSPRNIAGRLDGALDGRLLSVG